MNNQEILLISQTILVISLSGLGITMIISSIYHKKHPVSFKLISDQNVLEIKNRKTTTILNSLGLAFISSLISLALIPLIKKYPSYLFIIFATVIFSGSLIWEFVRRSIFVVRIFKKEKTIQINKAKYDLNKYNQWEITNRDLIYRIISAPGRKNGLYIVDSIEKKYKKVYGFPIDKDIQKLKDAILSFLNS